MSMNYRKILENSTLCFFLFIQPISNMKVIISNYEKQKNSAITREKDDELQQMPHGNEQVETETKMIILLSALSTK